MGHHVGTLDEVYEYPRTVAAGYQHGNTLGCDLRGNAALGAHASAAESALGGHDILAHILAGLNALYEP